jgi:hypothetical protein
LGKAAVVDELQIRWPSGSMQSWKKVAVNKKVIATEGSQELQTVPVKSLP